MAQNFIMRRDMSGKESNLVYAYSSLAQNHYAQKESARLEVGMKNRFVTGVISGVLCTLMACYIEML